MTRLIDSNVPEVQHITFDRFRPGMHTSELDVSFMIATRNRSAELRKTLDCCRNQIGVTVEILVVDDASTDETCEVVRREFPEVSVVRRDTNRGSIAARNDILERARGKYVIGLDDDSRFIDADACRRIVDRMDREPDLGIVSFQIIGPEFPERISQVDRLQGEWHTSSFAACGVALRRTMLERTGSFPEYFFHAYEEPDLCLRAWDTGYRVLQWNDILVYHEFSPLNRNEQRTHRQHARNEACSVWMRYPWNLVVPATLYRLAAQTRYAASRGCLLREPRVWLEVLGRLPRALVQRKPVCKEAVKISVAVNRFRVADPKKVWELGRLSWQEILCARKNARNG
jgi:GT2 family glycosyltransferase